METPMTNERWFPPPRPKDRDRKYPLPEDVYDVMDDEETEEEEDAKE